MGFMRAITPAICAYVHRRVWARGIDEDDVVADVFAVAWRRIDDVPTAPQELLCLYGVARRCVLRALRAQRRRTRLSARLSTEAERRTLVYGIEPEPASEAVRAAIASLRTRDREVLMLVMWEQLNHRDAAEVLGCSTNAVVIRLHRAKERLGRQLRRPEITPTLSESEVQSR
jgi:RNA polymerase sigma-70 factor (ECF subfamily)